jgi:hypothetical protein
MRQSMMDEQPYRVLVAVSDAQDLTVLPAIGVLIKIRPYQARPSVGTTK